MQLHRVPWCMHIVSTVITVVSRVGTHRCSTITLSYWALTRDTGCLPCVKIEVDGAYCSVYVRACGICMLVRAHAHGIRFTWYSARTHAQSARV